MAEQTFRFGRHQRLGKRADFARVFALRRRAYDGPLGMYLAPNELGFTRLGISMSRKVGNAVRRNRIKRMLRESFRLMQGQLPVGYDIVVVPRPHEPLPLAAYQALLAAMVTRLARRSE